MILFVSVHSFAINSDHDTDYIAGYKNTFTCYLWKNERGFIYGVIITNDSPKF